MAHSNVGLLNHGTFALPNANIAALGSHSISDMRNNERATIIQGGRNAHSQFGMDLDDDNETQDEKKADFDESSFYRLLFAQRRSVKKFENKITALSNVERVVFLCSFFLGSTSVLFVDVGNRESCAEDSSTIVGELLKLLAQKTRVSEAIFSKFEELMDVTERIIAETHSCLDTFAMCINYDRLVKYLFDHSFERGKIVVGEELLTYENVKSNVQDMLKSWNIGTEISVSIASYLAQLHGFGCWNLHDTDGRAGATAKRLWDGYVVGLGQVFLSESIVGDLIDGLDALEIEGLLSGALEKEDGAVKIHANARDLLVALGLAKQLNPHAVRTAVRIAVQRKRDDGDIVPITIQISAANFEYFEKKRKFDDGECLDILERVKASFLTLDFSSITRSREPVVQNSSNGEVAITFFVPVFERDALRRFLKEKFPKKFCSNEECSAVVSFRGLAGLTTEKCRSCQVLEERLQIRVIRAVSNRLMPSSADRNGKQGRLRDLSSTRRTEWSNHNRAERHLSLDELDLFSM